MKASIILAADAILRGGVSIFPTDTFFALGANALDPGAVRSVFELKGRGRHRPMPVLVSSAGHLGDVSDDVPPLAMALAERFWPGALTLVIRRSARVLGAVSGGEDTIGVRTPDHPVALEILRLAGVPVTGTSANPSGQPPTKDVAQIRTWFGNRVPAIVEADCGPFTVPSTVLDLTAPHPVILRVGGVPMSELLELVPDVTISGSR